MMDAQVATPSEPASYAALLESSELDGITEIPVTEARLAAMVTSSGRPGDSVIGHSRAGRAVTVADLAHVAALAGCLPSYMRVLIPVFEIIFDPGFPVALLTDSHASCYPLIVVNGAIRQELAINGRANVLGPGSRANATIGRAVWLGVTRLAADGDVGVSALGTAYRYSCVIGEDEEHSPWEPLSTALGKTTGDGTVTVLVASQLRYVSQQGSADPKHLLRAFADELSSVTEFNPLDVPFAGRPKGLLVMADDHRGHLDDAGWTRTDVQTCLHTLARRKAGVVRAAGYRSDRRLVGVPDEASLALYSGAQDFLLVSAGSGGSRSMIGACWYSDVRGVARAVPSSFPVWNGAAPTTVDDFAGLVDHYIDRGMTDGWPIVPPDAQGVAAMVAASGRDGDEVLGYAPWREGPITVRDAAINALMAGCRPDSAPLVTALFELVFASRHDQGTAGMAASTGGYNVWFVVHGPAARAAGLHTGAGLFGPGHRANVTLGRAVRLGLMNLAGLRPDLVDRSCLGQPYKYGCVIAEDEGSSPWGPLHASLGFAATDSVITMGWGSHPRLTLNDETQDGETLLRAIAENMSSIQGFDSPAMIAPGEQELTPEVLKWRDRITGRHPLLVVSPAHQAVLRDFSRADIQQRLGELSARTVSDARRAGYGSSPLIDPGQPDGDVIRLHRPERIHLLCAGGKRGGATMVNQFTYLASERYVDGRLLPSPQTV